MKILVPIKRVVDYNVKVRPLSDNTDVDLNNVKMAVNPFCEIALEEAVKLKEAGQASEVVAVSVGKGDSQEQLRTALALGADRAILVKTDDDTIIDSFIKRKTMVINWDNPDINQFYRIFPIKKSKKLKKEFKKIKFNFSYNLSSSQFLIDKIILGQLKLITSYSS